MPQSEVVAFLSTKPVLDGDTIKVDVPGVVFKVRRDDGAEVSVALNGEYPAAMYGRDTGRAFAPQSDSVVRLYPPVTGGKAVTYADSNDDAGLGLLKALADLLGYSLYRNSGAP